jgi:hypothetical protein
MGPLQRAINLIVALTLVALGWGGFAYFYFIDASWPWGMKVVAGIVEEYLGKGGVDATPRGKNASSLVTVRHCSIIPNPGRVRSRNDMGV